MTTDGIRHIQKIIGVEADGVWGPHSREAAKLHLRLMMPDPHPFPKSDLESLISFYGQPGDLKNLTQIDVLSLRVKYNGRSVRTIRVHKKCADSLLRVLELMVDEGYGYLLSQFAGVYENRNSRGLTTKSLHAWGAAIDIAPGQNGNRTKWPTAAHMPFEVMELFALHGWTAAGAFWGRDAMHFQATVP